MVDALRDVKIRLDDLQARLDEAENNLFLKDQQLKMANKQIETQASQIVQLQGQLVHVPFSKRTLVEADLSKSFEDARLFVKAIRALNFERIDAKQLKSTVKGILQKNLAKRRVSKDTVASIISKLQNEKLLGSGNQYFFSLR